MGEFNRGMGDPRAGSGWETPAPGQGTQQPSLREKLDASKRGRAQGETAPVPGSAEGATEGQLFAVAAPGQDAGPDYGYQRFRLHRNEELSVYAQERDERRALDSRLRHLIVLVVATVLVFLAVILLPSNVFDYDWVPHRSAAWYVKYLSQNVGDLVSLVTTGHAANSYAIVVFTALVMAASGAALGATGACYQGALKNAMASPSTLGVMSGGTVGSVVYVLANYSSESAEVSSSDLSVSLGTLASSVNQMDLGTYVTVLFGQSLCALVGCFLVVGLVLAIARIAGHGKVSNTALIISGQVFATVATSAITLVRYYLTVVAPGSAALTAVQNLQNGTVSATTTLVGVLIVVVPIAICLVLLFGMTHKLNLLAFSDEEARSMGLNVNRTRNAMVALCTLLTALVVSFCGAVGYVGFMVPLIVRRIVGSDFRYVVPASAAAGAIMLMVTYYLTSLNFIGMVSGRGLGMFTSIIGSVVFIVTVIRQRGRRNIDWV